jgi:hypothetical protein
MTGIFNAAYFSARLNWMVKHNLGKRNVKKKKLNLQMTRCVHFCVTESTMTAEGLTVY